MLEFVVRELPHHKQWSVAIQALFKETLNVDTTMRTVQTSVWFDEAQAGNFDITISAIVSTLLDPSDYLTPGMSPMGRRITPNGTTKPSMIWSNRSTVNSTPPSAKP